MLFRSLEIVGDRLVQDGAPLDQRDEAIRLAPELADVEDKIYTRDLFGSD